MQRIIFVFAVSLLFCVSSRAQTADEVKMDSDVQMVTSDTSTVTRFKVSDCDSLKNTKFLKYAFAYRKGRMALYDMIKKRSVTGFDYSYMECSCTSTQGETKMYVFTCLTADDKEGILFVHDDDDSTMFLGASNEEKDK